jgi:hypothetical protein
MAKYRVLEESYINLALVEEGTIIEYDGEVSSNLELVDDAPQRGRPKKDQEVLITE